MAERLLTYLTRFPDVLHYPDTDLAVALMFRAYKHAAKVRTISDNTNIISIFKTYPLQNDPGNIGVKPFYA